MLTNSNYGATGRPMGEPLSDTKLNEWPSAATRSTRAAPAASVRPTTTIGGRSRMPGDRMHRLAGDRRVDHPGSPARQHPSDDSGDSRANGRPVEGGEVRE